jgi:hypothetical protein
LQQEVMQFSTKPPLLRDITILWRRTARFVDLYVSSSGIFFLSFFCFFVVVHKATRAVMMWVLQTHPKFPPVQSRVLVIISLRFLKEHDLARVLFLFCSFIFHI